MVPPTPDPATPLTIRVTHLKCLKQTGDLGSDEPYVVVGTMSGSGVFSAVNVQASEVLDDVDEGEIHSFANGGVLAWGSLDSDGNVVPQAIPDPDLVIILVALMEHDSSVVDGIRSVAQGVLAGCMAAYGASNWSREDKVAGLRADLLGAIELGRVSKFNNDDVVGLIRVVPLTQDFLDGIQPGRSRALTLLFQNTEDDGRYEVQLMVRRFALPL